MKMTVQIYRKIRYFCFSGFINHRNLRCRRAKTCKNHRTVYDFGGSKITASKRVPRAFDGVEQRENQRKHRYFPYFFKVRSEPHGIPCEKTLIFYRKIRGFRKTSYFTCREPPGTPWRPKKYR